MCGRAAWGPANQPGGKDTGSHWQQPLGLYLLADDGTQKERVPDITQTACGIFFKAALDYDAAVSGMAVRSGCCV